MLLESPGRLLVSLCVDRLVTLSRGLSVFLCEDCGVIACSSRGAVTGPSCRDHAISNVQT